MWLEWIDNGNTMPAPINIIYYILYVLGVRLCGKIFGFFKEKCRCCQGNKVRISFLVIRKGKLENNTDPFGTECKLVKKEKETHYFYWT